MKKLLAVVLAAATVLSLGVSSLAAPAVDAAPAVKGVIEITIAEPTTAAAANDTVALTIGTTPAKTFTTAALAANDDAAKIATALATAAGSDADFTAAAAGAKLTFTAKTAGVVAGLGATKPTVSVALTGTVKGVTASVTAYTEGKAAVNAQPATGTDAYNSATMIDAGPVVESKDDLNDADGVKSGKTIYFHIDTAEYPTDNFDFTVSKGDGAKNIAKVSIVEKDFGTMSTVGTNPVDYNPPAGRQHFVKVELKENFTDAEYKVKFDLKAKCTDDYTNSDGVFVKGDNVKFDNVGYSWVKNTVLDADQDFAAGTGGVVLKPTKNEDNEITWEDENNTIARLTFFADSDVIKSYPKLSTKWDNADYAEYFADQNAFLFDWTGFTHDATKISSTSRATLEIYNPYYDEENDELVVDPDDVIIYSVDKDGTFTDVTASFKAGENDDGDYVFTTKTRELGTYIFAEAVAASTVEEEVEAPETDKEIPNTGR